MEEGEHGPGAEQPRDRVRAATTQEILQTARRLLVEQGPEAVSLRAIAREMGMTAPALYRYFGSHEELLRHRRRQTSSPSWPTTSGTAIHAVGSLDNTDSADVADLMALKMAAGCREFRAWALEHVPEFSMIFGSPMPGLEVVHEINRPDATAATSSARCSSTCSASCTAAAVPIPADDEIDPVAAQPA